MGLKLEGNKEVVKLQLLEWPLEADSKSESILTESNIKMLCSKGGEKACLQLSAKRLLVSS